MMTVKTLRSNIVEYASASSREELIGVGNHLYNTRSLLGRVFLFICSRKKLDARRELLLKRTKEAFSELIFHINNEYKRVCDNEKLQLDRKPYNAAELEESESYILYAGLFFKPLFKKSAKGAASPVLNWLWEGKELGELKKVSISLRLLQKKKDFELVTGSKIPHLSLRTLGGKENLSAKQMLRLKEWVEKVEKARLSTTLTFKGRERSFFSMGRKMHRLLYDLNAEFYKTDLGRIESLLKKLGLTSLGDPDPKHQKWQAELKEGQAVTTEPPVIVLGAEVTTEDEKKIGMRSFFVEGREDVLAVTYASGAESYISIEEEWQKHFGIPLRKTISRRLRGSLLLQEKIFDPLSTLEIDNKTALTVELQKELIPLIHLVSLLKQLPYTPQPLLPQGFAYNYDNQMRALYPMERSNVSFEGIEDFILGVVHGNGAAYSYVMRMAKMQEMEEAKSYKELLKKALNGEDIERAVTDHGKFALPKIIERRKVFYKSIRELQQSCVAALSRNGPLSFKLATRLGDVIEAQYSRWCPGSIVTQELTERVLKSLQIA